jgi:hypothetical protein
MESERGANEARESPHHEEETFNEKDLWRLLDEFMGRRANAGGDTDELDRTETITAVALFVGKVGWVMRLNPHLQLPADASMVRESPGLMLSHNNTNGTQAHESKKTRRSRRPGRR